jgi:DNA-binding LytR/AlgR family response regulator
MVHFCILILRSRTQKRENERLLMQLETPKNSIILKISGKDNERVNLEDIIMARKFLIDSVQNPKGVNTFVYVKNKKEPLQVSETIPELSKELTIHFGFLQSHKEFIINVAEVASKPIRQGIIRLSY